MDVPADVFSEVQKLVHTYIGVTLKSGKETLVASRMVRRMRALRLDDSRQYMNYLREEKTGEELTLFLDAITTNTTHFFRERLSFDVCIQMVEQWLAEGQKKFRFWSAASSTGQEPFTLAMMLFEVFQKHKGIDWKILATDINTQVLDHCRQGIYGDNAMESMPESYRKRFFTRTENGAWKINHNLQEHMVFNRLNLAKQPWPMKGPLDVVFCRNVMIYFENDVRHPLLAGIHGLLKSGGYLFVGHAESLSGFVSDFKTIKPSVYCKG